MKKCFIFLQDKIKRSSNFAVSNLRFIIVCMNINPKLA